MDSHSYCYKHRVCIPRANIRMLVFFYIQVAFYKHVLVVWIVCALLRRILAQPLGSTTKRVDPCLGCLILERRRLRLSVKAAWPVVSGSTEGVVEWSTEEQRRNNVSVVKQCTQDAVVRQSRSSYLLVIINGPSRRWVDLVVPTSSKRWRWKRWWWRDWPSGERRRGPGTLYVRPRHTLHVCSRSWKCQSEENDCHCHLKEALGVYLSSCHDVKVGRCKNYEHRECSWSPLNFRWHQKLSRAKKMWEWCTSKSCPRVVDGERSSGCQEARKCDDGIKKMHQCHSKASQNYLTSKTCLVVVKVRL